MLIKLYKMLTTSPTKKKFAKARESKRVRELIEDGKRNAVDHPIN